eukprot:TRINITY_DN13274_c0_g1_i1.p1 TRINITY_DN13274_c0_g1~~TRINITY_DN13274_c0_g1_i1.p1  ORF type:complete len:233 (+),score=35.87 TRINITY_DN13274_c0_g1_i1:75-773(+)
MGCGNGKDKKSTPLKVNAELSNSNARREDKVEVKMILLGDSGVGKSSISTRYSKNTFREEHEVTIGGSYFQKHLVTSNGTIAKLHIWDTGGSERFRSLTHVYYKDATAAIFVFDISKARSLEGIKFWMNDLSQSVNPKDMVLALAGNKSDKEPEDQLIIPMGKRYAEENNMFFKQTSALTGAGIEELFMSLVDTIVGKKRLRMCRLNGVSRYILLSHFVSDPKIFTFLLCYS